MPAAAQSTRPTVAILSFEYGTIEHWWSGNQDIGEGISDLLVDELVNDGSYRIIERKRLDAILAEQNFSQSERADPSAKTLAQVGKMLGVKYLIVGSVTKFGTENSNKSVGAGGFGAQVRHRQRRHGKRQGERRHRRAHDRHDDRRDPGERER